MKESNVDVVTCVNIHVMYACYDRSSENLFERYIKKKKKTGHLSHNVDFDIQKKQKTLISPVKRASRSYDPAWPCNSFPSLMIKVAEYMNSLEYRQAIEASNEHRQRLKSQQQLFCDNINGSSGEIKTRVEDKIKWFCFELVMSAIKRHAGVWIKICVATLEQRY